MSTVLDEPTTQPTTSPAQRLRTTMAGVRLSISWLGTRKSLNREQKSQAADTFGADSDYVSAAKKLLDTGQTEGRRWCSRASRSPGTATCRASQQDVWL